METGAGWRTISPGGVVTQAGNSVLYETGSWRTLRPIIHFDACSHCMICWLFCPDSAFLTEGKLLIGVDLEHCKGCGICAVECPKQCIEMVEEMAVRGGG
ncbi:MAG: 4Fe-4S binding protein [Chloroflexi bacterium]|nr:4Fe-4S binding protein [Chloroflexota bacterium]